MRDASGLTPRQNKILKMIRDFTAEYGYPPSIRQICEEVGISSTSVVSYNLDVLQRKGLLTRDRHVSRALRLVEEESLDERPHIMAQPPLSVPLLGTIAAGEPIPIPDNDFSQSDLERIALTADIVKNVDKVYALKVRGNSMIDALINDGDIVIMRHQTTANEGDMVAAWIKDEKATTLKRFHWDKNRGLVRLQPANPLMEPIYVDPNNLEIQGKVISVIRRLD